MQLRKIMTSIYEKRELLSADGSRLTFRKSRTLPGIVLIHSSSVVELSAVNRSVVGSNPTCGAMAPWSSG